MANKPPPKRILSDAFTVTQDGVEYQPHAGEWVDVLPGFTVGDMADTTHFQKLMDDKNAIGDDEPEALAEWLVRADAILGSLSLSIDSRMVGWNWTDARGRPFPEPSPEIVASLSWPELFYLLQAVRGQTETDRPNGSAPSPITSSATARPRTPSTSGGGRSRGRAS